MTGSRYRPIFSFSWAWRGIVISSAGFIPYGIPQIHLSRPGPCLYFTRTLFIIQGIPSLRLPTYSGRGFLAKLEMTRQSEWFGRRPCASYRKRRVSVEVGGFWRRIGWKWRLNPCRLLSNYDIGFVACNLNSNSSPGW